MSPFVLLLQSQLRDPIYLYELSQGVNLLLRVGKVEYTRCNFEIWLCISNFSVMSVTQLAMLANNF
jgi:hypothetical protein